MFTETMLLYTKIANGLGLTIVGMGVVFITLILISVSLDVLRVISANLENKKLLLASGTVMNDNFQIDAPKIPVEDEGELVAVITAAVSAISKTDPNYFTVKSIRSRPQHNPMWSLAGRQQQMEDRLMVQFKRGK